MPSLCIIPARALRDPEMTPRQLRVLLAVGQYTNAHGGGVWASQSTLAEDCGMDRAGVNKAMRALEARGYLRRVARFGDDGRQLSSIVDIVLTDEATPPVVKSATPPVASVTTPPVAADATPPVVTDATQTTQENDPRERPNTAVPDPAGFAEAWAAYPKRAGSNPRRDAVKAYAARLRAGASPADLLAGVHRYAAYIAATGREGTEYVQQAARFFGPSEPFREPWLPPKPAVLESDRDRARKAAYALHGLRAAQQSA